MKKLTSSDVIALGLAVFGAANLVAWALGWQATVAPTPGAAVAVVLGAAALFFASRSLLARVAGGLLAALSLAEMLMGIYAGPSDRSGLLLTPLHLSVGFLFSGLVATLMHGVKNKWAGWLIELACLGVLLLGVFHIVDQLTGLRSAPSESIDVSLTVTATLLAVLGLGLWISIRRIPGYQEFHVSAADWNITAVSGLILLLIASSAAVASFVIMAEQTERTMKDVLTVSLGNRTQLFESEINDAVRAASGVSQRRGFREALVHLSGSRGTAKDREKIAHTITRLLHGRYADFTAASIHDAHGRVLATAGRFVTDSELQAPLPLAQPAVLMWDDGLVLHMRLDIADERRALGVLRVDIRLKEIDAMLKDRAGLGTTGAIVLCGAPGEDLRCIRAQTGYRVEKISNRRPGDAAPMSYALAGAKGVSSGYAGADREVVAAYGPIGSLGIGMVLEIDKAEMQQPIRARLHGMLAALAVLALFGLLLLRWQITPLAARLIKEVVERRRAEEELRLLQRITSDITQAQDVRTALQVVLRRLCEATGWTFGQGWVPRSDFSCLEYIPAWYGDAELESFGASFRDHSFRPGQGLPGRVWVTKKPEWLRDGHMGIIPNPRRAERMRDAGIQARAGIPILADHEVVAVLEFGMRAQREDDPRFLDLASLIAAQLGNAIRRKRAEDALQEAEERYRALIQNSVEAIYLFDPKTKRVLECNDAFTELLGYTPSEALSLAIYDFVAHPKSDVDGFMDNLFTSGVVANSERQWRRKDGSIVDVQVSARRIQHRGRDLGFFIARDIGRRKQRENELVESKRRFQDLVESVDAIVWQADPETFRFTYVSPQAERILGYPTPAWLASETFWKDHLHSDDREQAIAYCVQATRAGRDHEFEYRMVAADGRVMWFRDKVTVVSHDGRPVQLHGILLDITQIKRAAQDLSDSEVRYRALIENSMEAIYLYDPDTREVLDANPAFLTLLGYEREDLGKLTMYDFIQHPRNTVGSFTQFFPQGQTGAMTIGERTWRGKNGIQRTMDVTAGRMHLGGEGKTIGFTVARDITEQKRTQERLTYLAHYDELTGLPNRTLFNENLRQILIEAGRRERLAAVMFLDLDRFKTINDTLGHEAGDTLLKSVAERLRDCVRRGDIIARLGGDEFTVALADVAQYDDVGQLAQKVLDNFAQPFRIGSRDLFVTTSIGVALYPRDHRDVEGLLKNADAAMYRAKEHGRNNYQFYTEEMNAKDSQRLALETHLRRALERNEFLLHYQPQVDLTSGTIIGMEALIRWQSPELGMVSPAEFIALAEETGLIVPIGEWVLRAACGQNKAWQDAGLPPLRISVNLSARQFRDRGLVGTVRRVLQETRLESKYLELELTESMLQNVDAAEAVLQELHGLGAHISIDDFGTGYSSLNYLKRFPIDNLKIDRSFVRDVISDPDDAAITDAIISMAHTLGIYVTAEGVETREQLAFLYQHRCDTIQGYYFSKPLAAEAFVALLRSGRRLTPSERLVVPDAKSARN